MLVSGPERYEISYTPKAFTVLCAKGTTKFSGLSTSNLPKLYIASIDGIPVYVGMTKQSIRARLRYGWKADGKDGFYGYAWRHHGSKATLDVWQHTDAIERNERDIETVEAEVVFLMRQAGQWPAFQTEIHFYPSNDEHRRIASEIVSRYNL
ncbi:UNVERIFIED_ORG: hypothetical protein LHK14_02070 [Roseateles sp. XES5]|nr:hypothetical protein [Roseateles sp. XES5]